MFLQKGEAHPLNARHEVPCDPEFGVLEHCSRVQGSRNKVQGAEVSAYGLLSEIRAMARADMAERVGFEPTRAFALHAFQTCLFGHSSTAPWNLVSYLAERAGFEPAVPFRIHRFSRAAP